MLKVRSMGDRQDHRQYTLAALAIWVAIAFGLWAQAQPAAQTNTLLLALQPIAASCDPS